MATAKINNKITLTRKLSSGEVETYAGQTQTFSMISGADKPLIDFSNGEKSIAKVTQNEGKLFLTLDNDVVAGLPDEVKESISFAGTNILEINPLADGTTPVEIDGAKNEVKVSVKARDGSTQYTCVINALGVQLQYGEHKSTYFSEDAEHSPKILHPTMSTKCFEEMVFNAKNRIKLAGVRSETLIANPTKIPPFMIGAYLQATNPNSDKVRDDEFVPESEIDSHKTFTSEDGKCQIFTATVPSTEKPGFKSYYFWKTLDAEHPENNKVFAYHVAGSSGNVFTSEVESSTITFNEGENPYVILNRHTGKPLDFMLPLESDSPYVPEKYLTMLEEFSGFTGKTFERSGTSDTKSLAREGSRFSFVADHEDKTETSDMKTRVRGSSLTADMEDSSEIEPPPPPEKVDEIPFVSTPKKVVKAKDLKINFDWGVNIMALGIILMLIAMPFAPAIAAILAGVGLTVATGGALLALNADRLSNPLLKLEKYIIDPLTKHERELENEQQAFWENSSELNKAQNKFVVNEALMNNDENPAVQYLKNIFGEEYEGFIGEGGFENRQAFIEELNALPADKQEEFIKKYFGADGVYGKAGVELSPEQIAELKTKIFTERATIDDAVKQVRALNAAQEAKDKLQNKQDSFLEDATDEVMGKIIRKNLYSAEAMNKFVEGNALALARYLTYHDYSDTKVNELTKNLSAESLEALENAAAKIEEAQTNLEEAVNQDVKNRRSLVGLTRYIETVRLTREAKGSATEFISDAQMSLAVQSMYTATELSATPGASTEATAAADMLIIPPENAIKTAVQARDAALTAAGFYRDTADDYMNGGPLAKHTIETTPLSTQIAGSLKQALMAENPTKVSEIEGKTTEELLTAIATGTLTGEKSALLAKAYEQNKQVDDEIANETTSFTKLAKRLDPSDTFTISEADINTKIPELETNSDFTGRSAADKKSIAKLALIMEERGVAKEKAITMILDGSLGVAAAHKYMKQAHPEVTTETSVEEARKKLTKTASVYIEKTYPLYQVLSNKQKKAVRDLNPKTLDEFERAIHEVVGSRVLPNGKTFKEVTGLNSEGGTTIAVAEGKMATLKKGYRNELENAQNKATVVLGEKKTKQITSETAARAIEKGKPLEAGAELHPGEGEVADDETKGIKGTKGTAKKYITEKKKIKVLEDKSKRLLKEYTRIMTSDLADDTKRRQLEALRGELLDVDDAVRDTGLKEKTLKEVVKVFDFPLPDITDPKFDWAKYGKDLTAKLEKIQKDNKGKIKANEFLLFGDKTPKAPKTAKQTRKNSRKLKTKFAEKAAAKRAAERPAPESADPALETPAPRHETEGEGA